MGLSLIKGNSGYIGIDKRGEVSSTGTTGNVSIRKHYLERRRGNFSPIEPPGPVNVLFEDDFATGDLSNWTVLNGSEASQWEVNTSSACLNSAGTPQTIPSGSTYAAFISNDGGTSNDYSPNSDVHMYFDFTIPADITVTSLTLEFDWMCFGERSTGVGSYDYGYINYLNKSHPSYDGRPVAGSEYTTDVQYMERVRGTNTSPNIDGGKFTGDGTSSRNNSASSGWVYENITIDATEITADSGSLWCDNDCTRSIVFSWASDSSIQDNPAWTIANVKLTYNL